MTILLIIIGVLFLVVYIKLREIISDIAEFKTHGLNMYCEDPSAHYHFTFSKKKAK